MKTMSWIPRFVTLWMISAAATSCIRDPLGHSSGDDGGSSGNGNVTFRISVPGRGSQSPTRALSEPDEWAVDTRDIAVLLFGADGGGFVGVYHGEVTGTSTGTGSDGSAAATIDFSVTIPIGGFYNMMVVANAGAILERHAATLTQGTSQATIEAALTAAISVPRGWETDPTARGARIPMWGYAAEVHSDEFVADPSDTGGTHRRFSRTIGLVRMLARVDVALSPELIAAGDFLLQSVRVYNFNKQGRLIPSTDRAVNGGFDWERVDADNLRNNTTPWIPSGGDVASNPATEWIDRTLPPGATELRGEIYLFEALAGIAPSASNDAHKTNPCIIIGGSFNGGATSYYRIDFAKKVNGSWVYMPLLRNNRYSVTITGVSSHGLPSPHDALESVPANIEANVIDWVGGDGITTVVSNGVYMLGLSHDAFLFPRQQQTVASRFNELKVVTDYAGGWNAQVFDDEGCTVATPTGSGWLTLSTASNPAADYPDGTTTRLLTDEMTPDGGESRSAWIRIAAGDLRYKIGVTQTLFEPYIRITRTGGDEELSALEFSSHEPAPQSFTVRWSPANTPLDMTRVRNGNDHFTWQNASNELKELPAGGEYTFTIDPATHQLVYRTRGSYLIFTLSDPSGRTAASAIALTQRSVFEDAPSPALDNIASPVALPHTGGEGGVPVRSTVSVTLADSGTTVTEAVPWTAQFSTDNGANWSDTPPAWLSGFPTQGEGNVDGESLTYAVSEATVPANALDARPSRGTAATPWNLANSTGAVSPDQNTANCYIISAPGWYSLPLVYGNAVRNGSGASATYTSPLSGDNNPNILQHFLRHDGNPINASYIYSNTGFTAQTSIADAVPVWMDAPGLVSGVTLDNGRQHLEFEVPAATITPGNAVVAVRDANGHVMWSWHIWVTDAEPTQTVDVTNYQGKTYSFMRQNLGTVGDGTPFIPSRSVVVRITQQIAGGLSRQFIIQSNCRDSYFNSTFYQFGRKDPIPGLKDGYTYYEGTMGVSTEPGNIRLGVRHPNIFFVGNATSQYDWNYNTLTTEGTSNPYKQGVDNLWDIDNNARTHNDNTVHKTVYDPSPVGFKVPPGGAFSGFTTTGNNSQTQSEWRVVDNSGEAFASDGGWKFLTDDTGGNHLFFPATGYLAYNTGKVGGASNGYCWSAGPINNGYGYYFQFNAGVVNPFGNGGRSTGVPIRPIRE